MPKPKFQRRHYTAIARVLSEFSAMAIDSGDLYLLESAETFRDRLIEVFRRDNPRFDVERFRTACDQR